MRVLDLTQAYSGPFCTQFLADFGAEVIKIEMPETGDMTRWWNPIVNGKSGYFTLVNRNKKSITLNLKRPEAKEIFLDLVKTADIVVENYRPGYAAKLGIDYETVKAAKHDIIYASLSGFGQYGPLRDRAAFAIIAEAMSGQMDLTGFPDGPPVKTGTSIGDTFTGTMLLVGILMALLHRERCGEGQYIDVAMTDVLFSATECNLPNYSLGADPTRIGNRDPLGAPYDAYRANDGWYVMGCGTPGHWIKICQVMQRPDLIEDPRFCDFVVRKENEEELTELINDWSKDKTRTELEEMFMPTGIPFAPVLTIAEAAQLEQIKARDMVVELDDPIMGKVMVPGVPIKMSTLEAAIESTSPELGQNNEEIYAGIGITKQVIQDLTDQGII